MSSLVEPFDDSEFNLRFKSPIPNLVIAGVSGREELGRMFEFRLDLRHREENVNYHDIIGQRVTLELDQFEEGAVRYFDGFVTDFQHSESHYNAKGELLYVRYEATVHPWLWFLTRTSDCRIFQKLSVPDIVQEVLRDNGMTDFRLDLTGKHREWEYCVQYRETDFNFISRLLEQEGIYYWFEHKAGVHTMVMVDSNDKAQACPGYEKIMFRPQEELQDDDCISSWVVRKALHPSKYAIAEYDFKKPKVKLLSRHMNKLEHSYQIPDPEVYDYPGEYVEIDEGDEYVKSRLQELQSQAVRIQASGPHRGLLVGHTFSLCDHPNDEFCKNKNLVIAVNHEINNGGFGMSADKSSRFYSCFFEAQDIACKEKSEFRPQRLTPKPVISGVHSAVVVGPDSEEIYCDEFGRIKVQFHWDRYGTLDENSSCWMRVSQAWADKNWGSMHIPRIGEEVLVSFLEGDPDRPIITGRVYHAENMPPYDLPGNKTQSGIKSRSTPGGGPDNFNEIRMEDKKGSEELYIQAEKNETILVKNDKKETVGHNETIDIGHDRTETVGHDETITVKNNRTETVMVNETLTVLNNRTRNVANNETVTVTMMRTHSVGINESINVGAAQEIVVGGLQEIAVGGMQSTDVGLARDVTVGRNQSHEISKDWTVTVGSNYSNTVGKDYVLDAGDSITLKCGSASIVLKKDGKITIKGSDITLKASGKINAKASSDVVIKGSNVKEN